MSRLCFVVDASVAWVGEALRRRGFEVYRAGREFSMGLPDLAVIELARAEQCVLVTRDNRMARIARRNGVPAVYVPEEWHKRYNSWDYVTKIVKEAAKALKR